MGYSNDAKIMYFWKMTERGKRKYHCTLPVRLLVVVILACLPVYDAATQISHGGEPAAALLRSPGRLPVIEMPAFDVSRYISDMEPDNNNGLKPLVFAKPFSVSIDPLKDGIWEELADGRRVWRVSIRSAGAYSLNIIFSRFTLAEGASVFLYSPSLNQVLGAFDYRNNQLRGTLAVSPVEGDRIIVEMQMQKGTTHYGELEIGTVAHDFIGIHNLKSSRFGFSGKCNIDINCPTGDNLQTEKNAVARLVINGIQLCTGVLVNNSANDGIPYLLTANHCIDNSIRAANTVFLFGYESPFCNGSDGPLNQSLSGSELLATQQNLDFTLVRLNEKPPKSYNAWYAGWSRSPDPPAAPVTSIHHPNGDVKKIAVSVEQPVTATFGSGYTANGHWHIGRWDLGTTEGGSSGSPLFDRNGSLMGLLTGGDARCGDAVDDFYCKFSLAWDRYEGTDSRLQPWLDPDSTDAVIVGGLNPWGEEELSARFTVNTTEICQGDRVVFTDFSTGNPETWAWDFGTGASPRTADSRGPHFVTYNQGGKRKVKLAVALAEEIDEKETEIEVAVNATNIPRAGFNYSQDGLEVAFLDLSENAASYYWEFGDRRTSTRQEPAHTYSQTGQYTVSQVVRNRACADTVQHIITLSPNFLPRQPETGIRVYPVPANTYLVIESEQVFDIDLHIELYSSGGSLVTREKIDAGAGSIVLNVERYPPGTYILKIIGGDEHIATRVQIIR